MADHSHRRYRHDLIATVVIFSACFAWWNGASTLLFRQALHLDIVTPAARLPWLATAQIASAISAILASSALFGRRHRSMASAAAFRSAIDSSELGIAMVDGLGILTYMNSSFTRMFRLGAAAQEGARFETVVGPSLVSERNPIAWPKPGEERVLDIRLDHMERGPVRLRTRKLAGGDLGWLISAHPADLTRGDMRNQIIPAHLGDMLSDAVLAVDIAASGLPIVTVNPGFEAMTGYRAAEVVGQSYRILSGRRSSLPEDPLAAMFERRLSAEATTPIERKDGSRIDVLLRIAPQPVVIGGTSVLLAVMRDVTRLRDLEQQVQRSVRTDPTTSLPNREYFRQTLDAMLAARPGPGFVAVLSVHRYRDLHASGGDTLCDALLVQVGARLAETQGAIVGRTGTDEFAVALPLAAESDAAGVAADFSRRLLATYVLPGSVLNLDFAFGYVVATGPADALGSLRQAGVALCKSRDGGFTPAVFDQRTDFAIRQRIRLLRDLQDALGRGEFVIHYQPRVDLASGEIIGAEALLRWDHPVFGLQPPERFLSIAEESGLIIEIGAWVIRTVMQFALSANAGRVQPLNFAINISPMQFRDGKLLGFLETILEKTGAEPAWFSLEMMSMELAGSPEQMAALCQRLRELGFGLALDDFSVACKILCQLDRFSLTQLKVDASFAGDPRNSIYAQTVIDGMALICRRLGVTLIAEAIESEKEHELLRRLGCRYGQGYHFSVPLAERDFLWLIDRHPVLPVPHAAAMPVEA